MNVWNNLTSKERQRLKNIGRIQNTDTLFAAYGLAPEELTLALIELDVDGKKAAETAATIMTIIHRSMHAIYLRRCDEIARTRSLTELRNQHILGIDPVQAHPDSSDDEAPAPTDDEDDDFSSFELTPLEDDQQLDPDTGQDNRAHDLQPARGQEGGST